MSSESNGYGKRMSNAYAVISDDNSDISLRPTPAKLRGAYTFKNCEEGVKDIIDGLSGKADYYPGLRFLHTYVATLHASIQYAMETKDEAARREELTHALKFLEYFGHSLFLELADHKAYFLLHFAEASGRKIETWWDGKQRGIGEVKSDGQIVWQLYPEKEFPPVEGETFTPVQTVAEETK